MHITSKILLINVTKLTCAPMCYRKSLNLGARLWPLCIELLQSVEMQYIILRQHICPTNLIQQKCVGPSHIRYG